MKCTILFFIAISMLSISTHAQKGYELGGWLGSSLYYGDLNPKLSFNKPGLAVGFTAKKNFNSRVSLRGAFSYANIAGADSLSQNTFQKNRNLSFKSAIWDLSAGIEFNFFPLEHRSNEHRSTPFVMAGMNIFHYNPQAVLNDTTYNLRDYTTEGQDRAYFPINAGLMLGGGYKWAIGNDWYVAIEGSMRFLLTDYLDDVSTVYPNLDELASNKGEIARRLSDRSITDGIGIEGRQRGDSKQRDRFAFVGISIMKYFGTLECPPISRVR